MKSRGIIGLVLWCLTIQLLVTGSHLFGEGKSAAKQQEVQVRRESIYIPYDKLKVLFEKKGRGVFIPYEQYESLWKKAQQKQSIQQPEQKKTFLINSSSSEANITNDVVNVKATLSLALFKKGWITIPLRLKNSAITQASIDGKAAIIKRTPQTGYELLYHKTEAKETTIKLELQYVKSFKKEAGRNRISFQAPRASIQRWEVAIPGKGIDINIQPALALTPKKADAADNKTCVVAYAGQGKEVAISWTPKTEGAKGLKALVSVNGIQQERIEEGLLRTKAELTYTISRSTLSSLKISVPRNQRIVNVSNPNIREWTVSQDGSNQHITVHLFEPASGTQSLVLELEQFLKEKMKNELTFPVIKALEATRQQGVVVVKVSQDFQVDVRHKTNLAQLDKSELPKKLKRTNWDFSFSYSMVPFTLSMNIKSAKPDIAVTTLTEIMVQPDKLDLVYSCIYNIRRTGVFSLNLTIPPNCNVISVQGMKKTGVKAAVIDNYYQESATMLKVSLARKAIGNIGFRVNLERPFTDSTRLTIPGNTASFQTPIPMPDCQTISQLNSVLAIYTRESIRLTPDKTSNLLPVSNKEAFKAIPATMSKSKKRLALTYAYNKNKPELQITAERRKPHITVRQLVFLQIESGVAKFKSTLFYTILYSGVKSLNLSIPESLKDQLQINTRDIQKQIKPSTTTEKEKRLIWSLSRDTEFIGNETIELSWEKNIDIPDVGKSIEIGIPRLIPENVNRSWGQIVLAKAESIDILPTETRKGLRAIDPRHNLMTGIKITNAARAFEFHRDWELTVEATRYEPEAVKATSIEDALVRFVITRSGDTSVQTIYRLRSNRQRLEIKLAGDVSFDTQPLRINDRPVILEKGNENSYYVPLAGLTADEPFLLELRYVIKQSSMTLVCPTFPLEPAIQQVNLAVYLPLNQKFIAASGPWSEESTWVIRGFNLEPCGAKSTNDLLAKVTGSINIDLANIKSFPTAGKRLLFSALRPTGGQKGGLHIYMMPSWLLKTIVTLLTLIGGIVLLRYSFKVRTIVIGSILVAFITTGIFVPSIVWSLPSNTVMAAVVILAFIWLGQTLIRSHKKSTPRKNNPVTG